MPLRFYFLLGFFSLLALFYPGDSPFFKIFAHHNTVFEAEVVETPLKIHDVPVVNSTAQPFLTAQGVYIVDLNSFTPVYQKNATVRFYPASTTKVITALVAEDIYDEEQVITVKRVLNEGQVMGLQENEQITVENLLYGILVHSGNDAAYALADAYGYDAFIELMNKKAKELGMHNSQFKNPAGLDEEGQYSSPQDLAIAGRAILKNPTLKKMVATKSITISDVNYRIFHTLSNVNSLLGEIQGLGGLKTGYTESAGQNLISFYKQSEDRQFIVVVLKSEDRFEDTRQIITWITSNVAYIKPSLK